MILIKGHPTETKIAPFEVGFLGAAAYPASFLVLNLFIGATFQQNREKKRRRPWLPQKGGGRFAENETAAKKGYRDVGKGPRERERERNR